MRRWSIVAGVLAALLVVGGGGVLAIAWRPAIAAIEPPARQSFDTELVRRGRDLAAIGNCSSCHTPRGGRDFAGGLPVPTPFGTIFSTNITPDSDTGIGHWSEAAFRRAMRSGVDRDGRHLYPTFPYDHFTDVTDDDDRALYAYLMTREPVRAPARQNQLSFPLDRRWLIAGWKLLFLRQGNYQPEPTRSAEWNRGAYLVEGLAHCGACHTPRNALGAERTDASFAGGNVDNWQAYALNGHSPAVVPWEKAALAAYLRQGWHPDHGTARGPMAEVVSNLSAVPASDVQAIATYMADVFGPRPPAPLPASEDTTASIADAAHPSGDNGAAIYKAACATCHESARPLPYGGIKLGLSTALSAPAPNNLANIVLSGVRPVEGERSPIMPGFAASMDDRQIAALLTYLRARFGKGPAWANVEQTIREARRTQIADLQTLAPPDHAPVDPVQRGNP
jgi:mono/diheme cytochrome c family protein